MNWYTLRYVLAVGGLAVGLCFAQAAKSETSLIIHGVSKHTGSYAYNENNTGLGLRYQVNPDWSVQAGSYRNSYNKQTTYVAGNWTPLHYGALKLGAFAGVGTGYNQPVMAGLLAVYDFGKVTATVRAVPGVGRLDSVVALEIGLKF